MCHAKNYRHKNLRIRFTWKWPYQVPNVVAATSITPNHAASHMQCEFKIIKNSSIACSVKMECQQECVTVPFPISKLFTTTKTFSRKSCYSVLGALKCVMNGVTYFWQNGLIFQFSRFRAFQHDIFTLQIIHIVNCFSWMLVATLDFSVQQKNKHSFLFAWFSFEINWIVHIVRANAVNPNDNGNQNEFHPRLSYYPAGK